jgi:hypothetical protein
VADAFRGTVVLQVLAAALTRTEAVWLRDDLWADACQALSLQPHLDDTRYQESFETAGVTVRRLSEQPIE